MSNEDNNVNDIKLIVQNGNKMGKSQYCPEKHVSLTRIYSSFLEKLVGFSKVMGNTNSNEAEK